MEGMSLIIIVPVSCCRDSIALSTPTTHDDYFLEIVMGYYSNPLNTDCCFPCFCLLSSDELYRVTPPVTSSALSAYLILPKVTICDSKNGIIFTTHAVKIFGSAHGYLRLPMLFIFHY